MSLISSLHTSFMGLRNTEAQISVTSSNITNADKTGYTKKVYESDYTTTSTGTAPAGGIVVTANYDTYLYETMVEDVSDSSYYDVLSSYLTNYADRLGDTDSDSTLNSALDDLMSSLSSLSQTPEDSSIKATVISNAELLTSEIRSLSTTVQNLRQQADTQIETAVDSINESLTTLEELNNRIARAEALGESTADLEDERRVELENIASYINIDYSISSDNQLKIYTGGRPLLDSTAHELSYTATNNINSAVSYPAEISGIYLNGADITESISGGELGALIDLRDDTLVAEQEKLDELSTNLMNELNSLQNDGASLPARSEITGEVEGFAGTDTFTATGSLQIATVNDAGEIQNTATIDLTTVTTIDDMIAAINTAMGGDVTASLNANGELEFVANNTGEGIAFNQLDSDISGDSFGSSFGLNNFFSGTGAENIYVSDYLLDSSEYLATSELSTSAIAGETGIFAGDGDLSAAMAEIFTENISFSAAGGFSSGSYSLSTYADKIMSSIATQASNAESQYDAANSLYLQSQTSLANLSGVNIDEEMTALVELESQYEAAAMVVSTIQDLFDQLIDAVR